ncbi:acetyl-CoA carboxylase biotin carboxylase subunit family protein [Streptomyces sp. NPDC056661]|uniref:ATP-grasp domain-containing protein n=1 Tax=Streptomyces sp. NPDC056661 TaxID=3345898 RepID=UPI0036B2F6CA
MTFLVLNRRPIVDKIPDWLADLDTDLVLVTARSVLTPRTLTKAADRYREIVVVDDYNSPDVERVALELARRNKVRRVLSTAEIDVIRAARIREQLGLPGQGVESALAYRDKYRMKTIVAAAGLAVSRMRLVRSPAEVSAFAEDGGFPVVLKPVAGGGSVGVGVVPDEAAIDLLAGDLRGEGATQLLAESWVAGETIVVDGLMAGGQVMQCWPVRMRHRNLTALTDAKPRIGWMLRRGDSLGERAVAFVEQVVAALPAPSEVTAFHAELFHTDDDRLLLGEIACRPGGCGHAPIFEQAFGVNLFAASLRGQAGCIDRVALNKPPQVLAGFGWFTPARGKLLAAPTKCSLPDVVSFTTTARVGSKYSGASSISDDIARVITTAPHGIDLDDRMSDIEEWWNASCRWAED